MLVKTNRCYVKLKFTICINSALALSENQGGMEFCNEGLSCWFITLLNIFCTLESAFTKIIATLSTDQASI